MISQSMFEKFKWNLICKDKTATHLAKFWSLHYIFHYSNKKTKILKNLRYYLLQIRKQKLTLHKVNKKFTFNITFVKIN